MSRRCYWRVPAGRTLDAVVGALESSEFLRQSRIIAEAWRQRRRRTRYEEIAGANHFTVIDPLDRSRQRDDGARRRLGAQRQRACRSRTSIAARSAMVSAAPTATTSTRITLRGMTRATWAPIKPADDRAGHQRQSLRPQHRALRCEHQRWRRGR